MKILYFHQHFVTPQAAGAVRSYAMAKKLLSRGHGVTMVCGSMGGGSTGLQSAFIRGMRRGLVDGIDVIEFDLAYSNRDGFIKRTKTFLQFAWRSVVVALTEKYDVVFATTTPLTAGIPGIAARWLRRKPFVFEVRDLWPELPRAMGAIKNPFVLHAMGCLEWMSYHSADRLIGLAPGIVSGISKCGIDSNRIDLVPNGCDLDIFESTAHAWRPESVADTDLLALYSGTHGMANGLDTLLEVAEELRLRGRDDIKLLLVGQGSTKDSLRERASQRQLTSLQFHDPVSKSQLAGLMAASDLGMQLLANVPAFYFGTSPNKFFDYLAAGLPVLNNYPGWLSEMISQHECGFAVPPNNPAAFADALEYAADNREELKAAGRRARELARNEFSRESLSSQWVDSIESVARFVAGRRYANGWLKRMADWLIALVALILLSPVLFCVAVLVKLFLGGPVLFKQPRIGRDSRQFTVYKFRSMSTAKDRNGSLLPDEQRLTGLGKFLRASSLDELPQLWNVLRGDLSLVGPRPLLVEYLPLYSKLQSRRHEVKPGITGWAQVNGRNAISWQRKFELDVWYVDHASWALDIKILWLTCLRVLRGSGVTQNGHATTERFTGNEQ